MVDMARRVRAPRETEADTRRHGPVVMFDDATVDDATVPVNDAALTGLVFVRQLNYPGQKEQKMTESVRQWLVAMIFRMAELQLARRNNARRPREDP